MTDKIKNLTKGSWRTTTAGIITGLSVIGSQIGPMLEGDFASVNWEAVGTGVGLLLMGLFARDNKVRSESVKAK